jgi:hypothetical protein
LRCSGRSITDYDSVFDPIRKAREEKSGHQAGDPIKAAEVLLKLLATENPPVHLLLGSDALKLVREKIDSLASEITAWEDLTLSTDFGSHSSANSSWTISRETCSAPAGTAQLSRPALTE